MTVKTERMKRFIIGFLLLSLLLPVLASCGAGMEAESETVSTYVPKAIDYEIVRIDGEDYLVFDEDAYAYYSAKMPPWVVPMFSSASDLKEALKNGKFSKTTAVRFPKDDHGIPIGNLDRLLEVVAPGYETTGYVWEGRIYSHDLRRPDDGAEIFAYFYPDEASYDEVFQADNITAYEGLKSEQIEERNATVTFLSGGRKSVRYECENEKRHIFVNEFYRKTTDLIPEYVRVYCREGDFWYRLIFAGLLDRPSEEWLLSIGVQLAP